MVPEQDLLTAQLLRPLVQSCSAAKLLSSKEVHQLTAQGRSTPSSPLICKMELLRAQLTQALCIALLRERSREQESRFHKYLQTLPHQVPTLQTFGSKAVAELQVCTSA